MWNIKLFLNNKSMQQKLKNMQNTEYNSQTSKPYIELPDQNNTSHIIKFFR